MIACPTCGASLPATATVCPLDGTPLAPGGAARGAGAMDELERDHPPFDAAAEKTDPSAKLPSGVFDKGIVLGSYRVLDIIGQGGMGQVYLAEHLKLGRQVALKVLRPEWAADPEIVKRFFVEAQAVNRIRHPAIVEVTDLVDEGGLVYFIMELLSGRSLKQRLSAEGALPLAELLAIARPIADALAAVHEAGVIHRDLKPDNVFLLDGAEPRVKLFDFGLAKLREPGSGAALDRDARPARIFGTPEYMAPEQIRCQPLDHRADLYSLGAILYEMLTGVRPVVAATVGDLLIRVAVDRPTPPSKLASMAGREVPPVLEGLILRCLEKEPALRPRDAREVLRELDAALEAVAGARRAGSAPPAPRPRRRWWLYAAAGLLLAAAAGVGVIALRPSAPSSQALPGRGGEPIAHLAQLWGDVQHRERGAASWRPAGHNLPLHYRDSVRTGRAARGRVEFKRGGSLEIDESSEVLIEPPVRDGEAPVPVVVAGTVRGEAAAGTPFRFRTPDRKVATVVAQGGAATLRLRAGEQGVELALLRGKAEVKGEGGAAVALGPSQLVELGAGRVSAPIELPPFPELAAPAVDAIVPTTSVQLSWNTVSAARRYRVQVSRFTSFDEKLANDVVATPRTTISGLTPGRYLWRVSSVGERGHEGEFGFARRFTLERPAATRPATQPVAMVAPLDGAVVEHVREPRPTVLRWQGEPRARYLVVLARGATLTRQVVQRRRVGGSSLAVGPLAPGSYSWGVYRIDGREARPLFAEPFRLKVVQRVAPDVKLRPIEWK
jgi:serine/threonine-protein kinase